MRHVMGAIVILALGSVSGFVARGAWYSKPGYPEMPWVKPAAENATTKPEKRADVEGDADRGAAAEDDAVTGDDPCRHRVENFCVAELDVVLKHLAEQSAYFIDARELHDFEAGHLIGAIHLPSSDIYGNIDNVMAVVPTPDQMLIVYCGGGQCEASKNVGQVLRDFKYTNVWLYEKGWEEVESSGKFGDHIERGG